MADIIKKIIFDTEAIIFDKQSEYDVQKIIHDKTAVFFRKTKVQFANEVRLSQKELAETERELSRMTRYCEELEFEVKQQSEILKELEKQNVELNQEYEAESKAKTAEIHSKELEAEAACIDLCKAKEVLENFKLCNSLAKDRQKKFMKVLHRDERNKIDEELKAIKRTFENMEQDMLEDNRKLEELYYYERKETLKVREEVKAIEDAIAEVQRQNDMMEEDMKRWEEENKEYDAKQAAAKSK